MGGEKGFLKNFFIPFVYFQNALRHGDHFEVGMLGYPTDNPPPPPPRCPLRPSPTNSPNSVGLSSAPCPCRNPRAHTVRPPCKDAPLEPPGPVPESPHQM